MNVRIHFHGAIDRRGLEQDHVATCPTGATVEQVLRHLGYPSTQLRSIVPLREGNRVPMSHILHDEDTLDILAPAGGG